MQKQSALGLAHPRSKIVFFIRLLGPYSFELSVSSDSGPTQRRAYIMKEQTTSNALLYSLLLMINDS